MTSNGNTAIGKAVAGPTSIALGKSAYADSAPWKPRHPRIWRLARRLMAWAGEHR